MISLFFVFTVYASDIYKRVTYIKGGYRNALLREKWCENSEPLPGFEPEYP